MIVTNLFSAVKRFPAATAPEFLSLPLFRAARAFHVCMCPRRADQTASHTASSRSKRYSKFHTTKKKPLICFIFCS